MQTVFLNGEFIPANEAKVSIFDRGFLFADSIYEVIPVFHNQYIGLEQHLSRLTQSLAAINLQLPLTQAEWKSIFDKLVKLNSHKEEELCIYLQITRGATETRSHAIPQGVAPTILVMCSPPSKKPLDLLTKGARAITHEDKRRKECFIKSTALLPNILAYQAAIEQNAAEAILVKNGYAMEGTSSNLFIVKDTVLITPPLQPQILAGVTRKVILQIAQANQIPTHEEMISVEALFDAEEVWLTGSTKEIYPIVSIDNKKIGEGKPGPRFQQIMALYQQFKLSGTLSSRLDENNSSLAE